MKFVVCLVAITLVIVSLETSNAEPGKSIEKKTKFVSITNKATEDAHVQCRSGKEIFTKTLKTEEKFRWGLQAEYAGAAICRVDLGGLHGHFSPFLAKYCKKDCRWRVFGDGLLNLNLGGGGWKSFELEIDYQAPAPAPRINDHEEAPANDKEAPEPAPAAARRNDKKAPASAPASRRNDKDAPAPSPETAVPLRNDKEASASAPAAA